MTIRWSYGHFDTTKGNTAFQDAFAWTMTHDPDYGVSGGGVVMRVDDDDGLEFMLRWGEVLRATVEQ